MSYTDGGYVKAKAKDAMQKQFLSFDRRPQLPRSQVSQQLYYDKMASNLNRCILEGSKPYWRDHQSLKGKYSS